MAVRYDSGVERLSIDVWSDVVCPWCYIGKRHLERALADFPNAVEITWHAFELDPRAPSTPPSGQSTAERLAAKYRVTVEQANAMIARVVDAGRRAGLEMKPGNAVPANTFDAHRLIRWARDHGRQGALKERLLKAHFVDGLPIGDRAQLAQLAGEVGLDAAEATAILDGDRYANEVRADEAQARELGITGVPFFVLDGRIGISGAQPVETLSAMLAKAWSELNVA
jgi:predicted DsbA family dithiol-disulfide isomerase